MRAKLGRHSCLKSSKSSELDRFGVGISLYFRFVKYLLVVFSILSVVTLPLLIVNCCGSWNDTWLFSSTLGSVS